MPMQTLTVTLTVVVANPLQFLPATLPTGVVNQAYSSTSIGTVTGGTAPYTFSATGLPAGMSLSSTGVLSGTPTVAGTANATVTITDSGS